MELTIDKQQFLRGLARTHGVADRKSSMHILSNVLLTAEGPDRLRLSATDLYLGVTAVVPANIKKGGTIAVAARTLFDIVKNLPDGEVSWKVSDTHAVELSCGKVRYRIPAMPGEDFPPLPNPGDADFVHLDAARLATTDGHRLSKAEHTVSGKGSMMNFSMLVPHKGIGELKRLLDDVKAGKGKGDDASTIGIATTGGNAFFQREDLCLSVKLADENFPPYNKVIPSKQSRTVIAARGPLVEALRRISLVANDKSGGVQLIIEPGMLRLQSQNPEVGEGSEEVDVDYAGDELKIGFNARYLLDALSALPYDEIAIELSGERDPGVLKPVGDNSDFIGVIMPMRI